MPKDQKLSLEAFTSLAALRRTIASIFTAPTLGERPPTLANALSLTDRYRISSMLPYRGWDDTFNVMVLDDGIEHAIGFGFELSPLIRAGDTTEHQLEAVLRACKPDTIVTFGLLSNNDIHLQVKAWLDKRNGPDNELPVLQEMAVRRAKWMLECASRTTLNGSQRFFARNVRAFAFFRMPYKGERGNAKAITQHIAECAELRDQIRGSLSGAQLYPEVLNEVHTKRVLMQLLNPQFKPETIDASVVSYHEPVRNLILKGNRLRVRESDSALVFTGGDQDTAATFVTVDHYPDMLDIMDTRGLTGNLFEHDSNIGDRFWLFTNVHILNSDAVKSQLTITLGKLNQQTLAESAWLRSMLAGVARRRDETQETLDILHTGRRMVRMMTGIMLLSDVHRTSVNNEYVVGLWRGAGFDASSEPLLGLPLYLASLPWSYSPNWDNGSEGLQRMTLAHTYNAACALPIASDWAGHSLSSGGPTLFSRRGQVSSFDLLRSDTNYNVTIVAESGAGKSFVMGELVSTYLSRGGMVRVIDAGRSYARQADILGGENMEFNPRDQKSLNPFWGVATIQDLNENMPMFQEMVLLMCFPRGATAQIVGYDWMAETIAEAITRSWEEHVGHLGTQHIYEYMRSRAGDDQRWSDLADQLKPYAVGRYAAWFNGPPELHLSNRFTILELDNLNQDKPFRSVIMSMILNLIVRELYTTHKNGATTKSGAIIPKLVVIDEAWDLMGKESGKSGKFIEEAARRIRKYKGTLATITQAYGDYYLSEAATAALNSSAWRFSLKQSSPSLAAAKEHRIFSSDEDPNIWRLLESVNRGPGYSEIHIKNGPVADIFRFVCDPFSYWTFTTDPDDKDALEACHAQGMSAIDAIAHCAAQTDAKQKEARARAA